MIYGAMTAQTQTCLVFAAMRNEGAFIVEWVSWYRMMGFQVLVGVNDCTDRSPELLQRLAEEGWVQWFDHAPRAGQPPKWSAYAAARRHPAVAVADWLLVCDVDEFLVLHQGDGSIGDYLANMDRDIGGIAFHWKIFGNSGWLRYQPGLTHRQFLRCGPGQRQVNTFFKTLIRDPLRFRKLSDHAPHDPDPTLPADPRPIVNAAGRPISRFATDPAPVRFSSVDEIDHTTAQMNHYIIRSDEHWAQKRGTPSASAGKNRYTDQFYQARNRNGSKDSSALAWADRFDPVFAQAMALPGVARLHHLCCADYVARLVTAAKGVAGDDPRWRWHMEQAG
jgi:hypothetical protein